MRRLPPLPLILGMALALASISACADCTERPMPWQDSAPPARMFLQLPFDTPIPVGRGNLQASVDLLNANSTIQASSPSLLVDIHAEMAQVNAMMRYGLSDRAELELVIPVVVVSGGFLDGAIDTVEGLFHASSPLRTRIDRYAVRIDVARSPVSSTATATASRSALGVVASRTAIATAPAASMSITRSGVGLGDVWAGAKFLVAEQAGMWPAVAVRGALKLPTGQNPYGSGELNVGASVLAGWRLSPFAVWLELDGAIPTGGFPDLQIATRPYGTFQAGAAWEFLDGVTLRAQASAHTSPIGGTGLDPLDLPTYYVLLGSTVAVNRNLDLTLGVAENVLSPGRGADFTVLLGVRGTL